MDSAYLFVTVILAMLPAVWAGYVFGWMRGYTEASENEIKRIPSTMAIGVALGRAQATARKVDDEPSALAEVQP